ncbi:MTH938/NDUFAF3 family protein [Rhizorhabdus argentea]|uniref:MTH938/NDUFAF3 family protein n=1 Tax=Rhizorhabdus argentea TaxID=1387174 RepID=UPI0030EBF218
MVSFDRELPAAGPTVRGFAGKAFRVEDRIVPGGLWLTPDDARDWTPPALEALTAEDVAALLAIQPPPEFLLLGTGPSMRRPSPAFAAAIEAMGFGIEAMDSRAAARAWNVLRGEDRWVVAALMPL